jgi:hypothetical protein
MNFINEKEKIIFSEIHFEIFYSKSEFFRMLKENKFKIIEWTENKGRLFVVLRK